jgi:peptide/nickel transport system substrate-binding protein
MLEEGRLTSNREERIADYKKFQELLNADAPAVFLYSPYYIYPQNKKIKGFTMKNITTPADRFSGVSNWYMKTGQRLEW